MRKSTFAIAVSFLAAFVWFGAQLNQPRAAEDDKQLVQNGNTSGCLVSTLMARKI
jgi:hypothetical protein